MVIGSDPDRVDLFNSLQLQICYRLLLQSLFYVHLVYYFLEELIKFVG